MNKRTSVLVKVTVIQLSWLLAAAITMMLQGQSSLLKNLAWTSFFAALYSPILFRVKNRPTPCTAWVYRLWQRDGSAIRSRG